MDGWVESIKNIRKYQISPNPNICENQSQNALQNPCVSVEIN
jgi:hypothetical protein